MKGIIKNEAAKETKFRPCLMEEERLASFAYWPFDSNEKCNVNAMAEAGFYWTGQKEGDDTAACFFCGKELDGWERNDIPWNEHRHHAPQCEFVKIGLAEDQLTMEQLTHIIEGSIRGNIEKTRIHFKTMVKKKFALYRDIYDKSLRKLG